MKFLSAAILGLTASVASASSGHYHVVAKVFINGKLVSSPRVDANENQEAEISQASEKSQEKTGMKLTASEDTSGNGIHLNLFVNYESKSGSVSGGQEIVATPGKEMTISPPTSSTYPNASLTVKLIATRE